MSQLNIKIPDDLTDKLRERAVREGHQTVEQYVESVLRAEVDDVGRLGGPEHLTFRSDEELEALLEARAHDAGEAIEATPEFWDDLKRQSESRRKKGA
jgi:hypothetical protein